MAKARAVVPHAVVLLDKPVRYSAAVLEIDTRHPGQPVGDGNRSRKMFASLQKASRVAVAKSSGNRKGTRSSNLFADPTNNYPIRILTSTCCVCDVMLGANFEEI